MAWVTVSFSANGGTLHSQSPLYYATGTQDWWKAQDKASQYAISSIDLPTWNNYEFKGFFTNQNGTGTKVCNAAGTLLANSLTSDTTVYAAWTKYYTITLDKGGGSGGTSTFYYSLADDKFYADSALTTEITSIVPPTGTGIFSGYFDNGVKVIDADGSFLEDLYQICFSGNKTFSAGWFGGVVDYFGLASANLVPIESESGDNKKRVCVTNATWSGATQTGGAGRYTYGVDSTSGVWRNPRVTYRVVGNMTLTLDLGKAFAAKTSGDVMTVSGYMITAAEVRTQIGEFPLVTVESTANEGADAINLFAVSIPIAANAHAQNLLSAIGGSGELQACTARASCDPVVCAENNMPCASDVVRGKIDVTGDIIMLDASAPTAGTGFTLVGDPKKTREGVFPEYTATVTKEIV